MTNEFSPESKAATKVIAKACNWVARRKAVQFAPKSQRAREVGRLEASGNELAEAVEHYEKAGKAGQP